MKQKLLEKEILSSLFFNGERIPEALQIISTDDFVELRHEAQIVFDCWREGKNTTNELYAKGYKVSEIIDQALFPRPLEKACHELKNISNRRNLSQILSEAYKNVPEDNLDKFIGSVQQRLVKILETSEREDTNIETVVREFEKYQELFEEKKRNGGKLLGLSSGYTKIDEVIDGLRPGHLWVIGGYTNLGKTTASLNILTHLLKQGHRTVFYSLEMSRVDIIARMLGIMLGENSRTISKGYADAKKVKSAIEVIKHSRLGIHTSKKDISQILLSMYEETLKDKPELFVVDFLQLVTAQGTRDEYQTTTKVILELQNAALRFGVPIIALSQVSNEGARLGDQQVMGFKGSGHIASAADLAIELVSGEDSVKELREKMKNGEPVFIKWHIKKNRHGPVGSVLMEFTGKTGVFTEVNDPEL